MKKIILAVVFLSSIASSEFFGLTKKAFAETEAWRLRFTSDDYQAFYTQSSKTYTAMRDIIIRGRELAIESQEGRLGASDRSYLNAEWMQLEWAFERAVTDTQFTDSFLDSYKYVLDGIEFDTVVQNPITHASYVKRVHIQPTSLTNLGNLASDTYPVQLAPQPNAGYLIINGTNVSSPISTDDTLSFMMNHTSAISIAKMINNKSGQTKVTAEQVSPVLTVEPSFSSFSGTLAGDSFKINGVQVTGTGIRSINFLIEAINNVASLSGVKARLTSGHWGQQMDLYTLDGRNITVEVSAGIPAVSKLLGGSVPTEQYFTVAGKVRLMSASEIQIQAVDYENMPLPPNTLLTIPVTTAYNIQRVSLRTMDEASDALKVLDKALTEINDRLSEL